MVEELTSADFAARVGQPFTVRLTGIEPVELTLASVDLPGPSAGAGEMGAFTMTLRNEEDEEVETTPGVTLSDLFEAYGLIIPTEVEELAAPEEAAP